MKQRKLTEEQKSNLKNWTRLTRNLNGIETFEELEHHIKFNHARSILIPEVNQIEPFTADRWIGQFCELFGILGVVLFIIYYFVTLLVVRLPIYTYRRAVNYIHFERNKEELKKSFEELKP